MMTLKSKTRDEDEGADRGQKKRRSTYAEDFFPDLVQRCFGKETDYTCLTPSTDPHDKTAIILDSP